MEVWHDHPAALSPVGSSSFGSCFVDGGAQQRAIASNRHHVPARCESGRKCRYDYTDADADGVPLRPGTGRLDHLCLLVGNLADFLVDAKAGVEQFLGCVLGKGTCVAAARTEP